CPRIRAHHARRHSERPQGERGCEGILPRCRGGRAAFLPGGEELQAAQKMARMSDHYDTRETADPGERERELFGQLPDVIAAALAAPAWRAHLGDVDPEGVTSRTALANLPVLRKSSLPALQKETPPLGGLSVVP